LTKELKQHTVATLKTSPRREGEEGGGRGGEDEAKRRRILEGRGSSTVVWPARTEAMKMEMEMMKNEALTITFTAMIKANVFRHGSSP
jgi:hypothetical protein